MAFIFLFIYFNYMLKTGYHVSVVDWVCLFIVGVLQVITWLVRTGLMTDLVKSPADGKKSSTSDDWFRD